MNAFIERLPIKTKLVLITMGVSVTGLIAAITVGMIYGNHLMKKNLVADISSTARLMADRCSAALVFDDENLGRENLSSLGTKPAISAACIYNEAGAIFAGYNSAAGSGVACPERAGQSGYSFQKNSLTLFEPVLFNGKQVGAVFIYADLKELHRKMLNLLVIMSFIFLVITAVSFALSARFQRLVSEPLTRLTGTALHIAVEKDYGVRAAKGSHDEIGVLVDAFNEMLGTIQAQDRDNKQLNSELEARVQNRTAQVEAVNEELKKAKDVAESANRTKGVFLASMSHEIRTPLNAILGFSQLLNRDPDITPKQKHQVDTINRSGRHLLALINDILEISKIEAGRAKLNPAAFDLGGLLGDLELMFRQRAEGAGLSLLVEKSPELPLYVLGDEGKLRQILINLLGNAFKFTAKGGILLRAGAKSGKDGFRFIAEVEDTGPGMTAEEQQRLFSPFEQAKAGQEAGGGTGLGLAISREYARLMDGDITVLSQAGKGSVFKLDILLKEASAVAAAAKEDLRRVEHLAPGQQAYRVLIADDKADNRDFLGQLLGYVGFDYRQAVDGAEAVKIFNEWKPQLILMDIKMPVMDGYEATLRIRSAPGGKETRIMVLSASAIGEIRQEAISNGADDYLAKPFREGELFDKMRRLLGAEYVYEEAGPAVQAPAAAEVLSPAVFARLPAELTDRIREAALSGDFDRLAELAAEAGRTSPEAGSALKTFAGRFDARGILGAVGR